MESLSPACRSLLALLRPCAPTSGGRVALPISPGDWGAVASLAEHHGVSPLLHSGLHSRALLGHVPGPVRDSLQAARRATALDNLRKCGEFHRIARALQGSGIPVLPLKGIHLAELVYCDISLRPMSDLDVLVPRASVARALAILSLLDYGHETDPAPAIDETLRKKCNLGLSHRRDPVWLEIHWSLGEPPDRYAAVVDEIWRRAVPGRLADADTCLMPPEFLLLHVCAHLACSHGFAFSLRALCDVARIVDAYPRMQWDVVVEHGKRHGWQRGVAAALLLAVEHLGAEVPEEVLGALGARQLDREMLAEAMAHLVTCVDLPRSLLTAPNLLAAAGGKSTLQFPAALWARVFVPREELALVYGLPADSPRLPAYYAVRLRDLIRRYAADAWALKFADPALGAAAARHARLGAWIAEPAQASRPGPTV